MSGTFKMKFDSKEWNSSSSTDYIVAQPSPGDNYLPGGCESESKIKCEVEEFTDNKSTVCSETSALCSADSSNQLIDSAELTENVKEEFSEEASSDQSYHSSSNLSEAEMDTDSLSTQSYMKRETNCKRNFQQHEEQAVTASDVASTSHSPDDTAECNRCPVCKKIFSSFQDLKQHVQVQHEHPSESQHDHTPSTDALSDASSDTQGSESDDDSAWSNNKRCTKEVLKSHISTEYVNQKHWECSQCSKCFSKKFGLTKHIRSVHENEKPYECSSCHKKFITPYLRDRHWKSVHSGEKPLACDRCDYKCSEKGRLTKHQQTVHGVRRYPCAESQRASLAGCTLKQHCISVHYKEIPQCSLCGKTFSEPAALKRHIDSVHKCLKPYSCTECSSKFAKRQTLESHINAVHRKEKPHSCSVCSKSFSTKTYLRIHVDAVHNHKRHQCQQCSKSFSERSALNRHVKTQHK